MYWRSDCFVYSVTWYKERSGVQHEFLHFYISSPDGRHWSTVIAERGKVDGQPAASPSPFSSRSTSDRVAADMVFAATLGTTGATGIDGRCAPARAIRLHSLTFPDGNGPSAHQLAMLLVAMSTVKEKYHLLASQCYWFSATGFKALVRLFPGAKAEEDIHSKQKGTCYGLPIPFASVVDMVCTTYEEKQQEIYGGVYHGPADPTHC